LALIADYRLLAVTREVLGTAKVFVQEKVMPAPAEGGDAMHVALCAVHRVEFLLSWNVRHLANQNKVRHLQRMCARFG
jgi:hypothetical protein